MVVSACGSKGGGHGACYYPAEEVRGVTYKNGSGSKGGDVEHGAIH